MGRDSGDSGGKFGSRLVNADNGFVEGDGVTDFDTDTKGLVGDISDEEVSVLDVAKGDLHHLAGLIGRKVIFFDKAVGRDIE